MIIFPAIDLKDGIPVRLTKGEFSTAEQVAGQAVETALRFKTLGATHLHMVDLNGALSGRGVNREIVAECKRNSGLFVQVGGGIRDTKSVEYYLSRGVDRVILGSIALKDPGFARFCVGEYGEKVAVGIDARNRKVSVSGWTETSETDFIEFAKSIEDAGVSNIIFTDIDRDGTFQGANLELMAELNDAVSCTLTASGGVKDINDIIALKKLNIYGAICGKSIYSGSLDLQEALQAAL